MAIMMRFLFILMFAVLVSAPARAMDHSEDEFRLWLEVLKEDAIREGISEAVVHDALDDEMPNERVLTLDKKQPEKTITFEDYASGVVSDAKINKAKQLADDYEDELGKVSKQYGVPTEVILALWGVESGFGKHMGNFSVVNSLMTLAYEGRRAAFFRKELMEALHVLDEEHIAADDLRGSWAGAMGQCQFMPSTYRHYAADADDDKRRDIWKNEADVFASIANYIVAEGWGKSVSWGNEASVASPIASDEVGLGYERTIDEWHALGVTILDGSDVKDAGDTQASLVQPDGPGGRSFLVYDNFRALMRWNRSTYFATSVGLLADRIK